MITSSTGYSKTKAYIIALFLVVIMILIKPITTKAVTIGSLNSNPNAALNVMKLSNQNALKVEFKCITKKDKALSYDLYIYDRNNNNKKIYGGYASLYNYPSRKTMEKKTSYISISGAKKKNKRYNLLIVFKSKLTERRKHLGSIVYRKGRVVKRNYFYTYNTIGRYTRSAYYSCR